MVTSREADKVQAFAATLPGSGHIGLGFDQGDTDSIPNFVEQVVDQVSKIDILVNNAGGGSAASIENATAEVELSISEKGEYFRLTLFLVPIEGRWLLECFQLIKDPLVLCKSAQNPISVKALN